MGLDFLSTATLLPLVFNFELFPLDILSIYCVFGKNLSRAIE